MDRGFYTSFTVAFLLGTTSCWAAPGALDTSFDSDGMVVTPIGTGNDEGRAVALQPDGKVLVAGKSSNGTDDDCALVRYNPDGSLDTSFDGDGKVVTPKVCTGCYPLTPIYS